MCSDHSAISIEIDISESDRGPGIWCFNNELLNDEEFVNQLKEHINETKSTFVNLNECDWWELIKFEIGQFGREWSKELARNRKDSVFDLYTKLVHMQNEIIKDSNKFDKQLWANMDTITSEIKAHEIVDAKCATFRCRKQWTQYGELSSKYYFNLEKRNHQSKTMYIVHKNDGTLTKDYTEILNLQYKFYNHLYTSNERGSFDSINTNG